eukprot:CAMPEP_0185812748 /NCGR_PEP_ID=MMETSP1322-20130828/9808_1 /TAXON_ID=265543 /ORGANISM="Minutocellus polymorphus, Strain RCC2270" /LENGTH=41 /DNA_ID= /DNA_START= /DNA_END= /DNA_ORIENTATION=
MPHDWQLECKMKVSLQVELGIETAFWIAESPFATEKHVCMS